MTSSTDKQQTEFETSVKFVRNFTGPIFEVIAGSERRKFLAHAGILKQSEKLAAQIEGNWKEVLDREIPLDDWDEATVASFVEWLYIHDYEGPYPAKLPSPAPAEGKASKMFQGKVGKKNTQGQDNRIPSKTADTSMGDTHRPLTPIDEIHFSYPHDPELSYNSQDFLDYAARVSEPRDTFDYQYLLLTHAKIYVLADYMLLPDLQSEALERLKFALQFIGPLSELSNPQASVVPNLVDLTAYVYAHTDKLTSKQEPLRKLISTYIALNFVQFDGERVQGLMEQGGDFVVDLWQKLRRSAR